MYMTLKSDYACNKLFGATGSFYRVTKSGNPDRRYKLAKVLEDSGIAQKAKKNNEALNKSRVIAESRKKQKKTSLRQKVSGFFKILFIFALVIATPLSYAITESL